MFFSSLLAEIIGDTFGMNLYNRGDAFLRKHEIDISPVVVEHIFRKYGRTVRVSADSERSSVESAGRSEAVS